MGYSLGLATYLALSNGLEGFANRKLEQRLQAGKEDPDRISERRGMASITRPDGPLIWFHAASVGESLSLIELINKLLESRPDLQIMITTGTRTSADLLSVRLPDQVIHQFAPVDTLAFVRPFLDHWKPDLAIWTESELWPAMIAETHAQGTPMVLLNARMSQKSHDAWRWMPAFAGSLLNRFDRILVQDQKSAFFLRRLGASQFRVRINGSLKESTGALPYDEAERNALAEKLDNRKVWLAASTHDDEELIVAEANRIVLGEDHRAILIIAPRHPERGPMIAEVLRNDGWQVGLRSAGDMPEANTQIYIADTMGEMGLWYRLAPVSFIGGSLAMIGGHNPFEPAALGSAILHGPHVLNAQEIYKALGNAGGARQIKGAKSLAKAVIYLLEPHKAAAMAHAAWEVSSSGAEATDTALKLLLEMLDNAARRN